MVHSSAEPPLDFCEVIEFLFFISNAAVAFPLTHKGQRV